jgi:hypothetical protein
MVSVSKVISKIKEEDWQYLLLGLQEKFDITQYDLLSKVGIKVSPKISLWINGKNTPLYNSKIKFLEFILHKHLNIKRLIKFGKRVRSSIKFKNKWISVKDALTKNDFKNKLIIKKKNELYLNTPQLFPSSKDDKTIYFKPYKNRLLIFYHEKRSTRPHPLFIPRSLRLDEDFLVGLGIYLAEGARNRKSKVTNSEPKIINQAIKFFKLIGVDKHELKGWIQLHERSEKSKEEARIFWIKNTDLEKNNITTVSIKKSTGNAKVKQYGTLHLESTFILPELLVNNLLKFIPKILKNLSQQQSIWFLQGAYAGEGSVNITKTGSLNMIRYTSTNVLERGLIRDSLKNLGANVHESFKRYDLSVMGYKNLEKLIFLDIFRYHPLRKKKLINGFKKLEKSHIPGLNKEKIISLLEDKTIFSTSDISEHLNISNEGVFRHLNELSKTGEIEKICGKGSIQNKWFIKSI